MKLMTQTKWNVYETNMYEMKCTCMNSALYQKEDVLHLLMVCLDNDMVKILFAIK